MNTLLDYNDKMQSQKYASLGKRLVAMFIDACILLLIERFFAMFMGHKLGSTLTFFIGMGYFSILETSSSQASFGKVALGLRVCDTDGRTISTTKAVIRYFMKYISTCLFFIGCIMAAFSDKKQSLHDLVAGTLVVES
jgi:uncharacterized RDD family membrane protein YckC